MPLKTLEAVIIVISIYLMLAFALRLIRLEDRDTMGDAIRKDVWRKLSGKSASEIPAGPPLSELVSFEVRMEEILGKATKAELTTCLRMGIDEFIRRKNQESQEEGIE